GSIVLPYTPLSRSNVSRVAVAALDLAGNTQLQHVTENGQVDDALEPTILEVAALRVDPGFKFIGRTFRLEQNRATGRTASEEPPLRAFEHLNIVEVVECAGP